MQSSTTQKQQYYQLSCPQLPLGVYREIAAHLRQVEDVNTGLISRPLSDPQGKFDYQQSQIQALWIEHPLNLSRDRQEQIQAILDYYAQRYRPWEQVTVNSQQSTV